MRALVLALLLGSAGAINLQAPVLPDPLMTPGDALTSDPALICKAGYTKSVRSGPQALKAQVYREYSITSRAPGEYEIDHLISLELGGSNSIRNLWPESFRTQPLNAHVKDTVENKLHDLACSGFISFTQAQQAIAQNWEAAYVKYVGPLPGGAQVSVPTPRLPGSTGVVIPATPLPSGTTIVPATPVPQPVPASSHGLQAPGAVAPLPDGGCPDTAPVKVSRRGIYHLPQGDGNYAATSATVCFVTATQAEQAGYRGIK